MKIANSSDVPKFRLASTFVLLEILTVEEMKPMFELVFRLTRVFVLVRENKSYSSVAFVSVYSPLQFSTCPLKSSRNIQVLPSFSILYYCASLILCESVSWCFVTSYSIKRGICIGNTESINLDV